MVKFCSFLILNVRNAKTKFTLYMWSVINMVAPIYAKS